MEKAKTLAKAVENGSFDGALETLYGKDRVLAQRKRYIRLLEGFVKMYGDRETALFSVPGRTEISGNHTDHQHGRVLAAAVDIDIIAAASPSDDGIARIKSEGYPEDSVTVASPDASKARKGSFGAIISGVCRAFENNGRATGGFVAYTMSDVLTGSGLSSSAAFEVMVGTILNRFYNGGSVGAVEIAKCGQYAENVFFGKPCGLMDQAACSVGGFAYMDFEDPENVKIERLSLSLGDYVLCIINTGGNHADLTGDYASVPEEMKSVAARFGKEYLREVDPDEFYSSIASLRSVCGDRAVLRASHFFAENERVEKQRARIKAGDLEGFLRLVSESGDSSFKQLQNIYTTKNVSEQGLSLALSVCERLGAVCRVHGGGFAGTVQAYVKRDRAERFGKELSAVFGDGSCMFLSIRPFGAVTVEADRIIEGDRVFDVRRA